MNRNYNYIDFIKQKEKINKPSGFEVDEKLLNQYLYPFQIFIVKRALKYGKYAIFANCGLGKTLMQLEWANQVYKYTNKPVLILCPLAVAKQTIREGHKFDIKVRKFDEDNIDFPIQVINYEQLDNIDSSIYSGVVLDESSILKNYEGKIKIKILDLFYKTDYKLACTATPSPNDPVEIGNHCEFLNIMSRNEMLSIYFVHDGGDTSKWRVKKHARSLFYKFISSWAIMVNTPSDIGFSDDGFILPPLNLIEKQIKVPRRSTTKGFFNDEAVSSITFNRELKLTLNERLKITADICNQSDEQFIIWISHNEEGIILKKLIPGSIEVSGNDSTETKEKLLGNFALNKYRVLITKKKIAQFGLNFQNCHNQIHASLDFSFESFYQAVRRSYRFKQNHVVNIYYITTDTMLNVKKSIDNKQKEFDTMQREMKKYINIDDHENNTDNDKSIGEIVKTKKYWIENGDSIQLIKKVKDNFVDFSVFSPPFVDLYTYSNSINDISNCKNYDQFFKHFEFLIPEIYRIIKPGRNIAIHCMDIPIQKGKEGYIGLRDFSGKIIKSFEKVGFIYHSRITIWKNPVTEMQRTKALGLLHKQTKKDATMSRVGIPDYVLIFRKDGEREYPVILNISVDEWQKIASPVWMDINQSDTLNARVARENEDEKHLCPLQLGVIQRLIKLYTNEGDTVFTPFMGIGSEVYEAINLNRKGIGFELKKSYFNIAKSNLEVISNRLGRTLGI